MLKFKHNCLFLCLFSVFLYMFLYHPFHYTDNKITYSVKDPCPPPHGIFCAKEKHLLVVWRRRRRRRSKGEEGETVHLKTHATARAMGKKNPETFTIGQQILYPNFKKNPLGMLHSITSSVKTLVNKYNAVCVLTEY